jgi:Flp pilus assembly protein TadD
MTVQAAMEQAVQRHQAGDLNEAEAIYRKVLAVAPNLPDALNLLGVLLQQRGRLPEAAELISRAIQLAPATADFHYNMGVVLSAQKHLEHAESAFRHALSLRPGDPTIHHNLGAALQARGRYTEAVAEFRSAVGLSPHNAKLLSGFGSALADVGQWDEAIARNRQSLALNPDSAETHLNLGVLLLRAGDFDAGWPEYEWRWRVKNLEVGPVTSHKKIWDGGDLSGKRILLHCEQGFGDAIQMIRYAPMVKQRGGKTIIFCQMELERLFRTAEGIDEIITWKDLPPPCEEHSPLMSLPGALKTKLETIPNRVPYLHADKELVKQWRDRIGDKNRLKVGIGWAGQSGHPKDHQRSIPLQRFEFLGKLPNVRLFSLQKGKPAAQVRESEMEITDWSQEFTDFADTAALVENLDLVVTIDSAVAHLGAALAKKTWVLLPFVSDYRWLLDRNDSPWYPTMRLFRQKIMDDWQPPLDELAEAIKQL